MQIFGKDNYANQNYANPTLSFIIKDQLSNL